MPESRLETFQTLAYTIGGFILFPLNKVDNKMTINAARGLNNSIKDRFDLTLECIRRHYLGLDNPLQETLDRYADFFDLFGSFKGYVEFFLLQDLVSEDSSAVKFFLPFESFDNSPLPRDRDDYFVYSDRSMYFLNARNQRIVLTP